MIARVAAVAGLALAIVIVAVVVLGGNGSKTYFIDFQNAGQLVKGDDVQDRGKGLQVNQSSKYFGPSLSSADQVIVEVLRDQGAFTNFLANSSKLVTDVAARRSDLSSLVANANATAGAIAQENTSFDTDLALLPGTLRKANTTFVNLRATLVDLTTLVNTSKPVAPQLAPV